MMVKLKGCTCCDEKPELQMIGLPVFGDEYRVSCEKCKEHTQWYNDFDDAIDAWNEHVDKVRKEVRNE